MEDENASDDHHGLEIALIRQRQSEQLPAKRRGGSKSRQSVRVITNAPVCCISVSVSVSVAVSVSVSRPVSVSLSFPF
jgi:hypothetical protein